MLNNRDGRWIVVKRVWRWKGGAIMVLGIMLRWTNDVMHVKAMGSSNSDRTLLYKNNWKQRGETNDETSADAGAWRTRC